MKKQILFLAMFSLAMIFANLNSNGQTVTYTRNLTGAPTKTAAVPLTCAMAADALHPIPGATYNYTLTANPAAATPGGYIRWFVTDQTTIIDGTGTAPVLQTDHDAGDGSGDYILLADPARYDLTTNITPSISISWKYFDGNAQTVLLVAYIMDNNGCTNNVEVYRIIPTFGFTLDIAALLDAGTPGNTECVSPVESAVYAPGTPGNLTMNYGENWVFFSVTAANFVHSWMPNIQSLNYTGTGTVDAASLQWAYPADAIANTAWHATTEAVLARDASGAVGPLGEDIVVRARIVHAADQRIAAGVLTLGIDGTMYNPAGGNYTTVTLADMDNPTTGTACAQNITDRAEYTLTPRPSLTSTTVGVNPPYPNPETWIPKN